MSCVTRSIYDLGHLNDSFQHSSHCTTYDKLRAIQAVERSDRLHAAAEFTPDHGHEAEHHPCAAGICP